MQRIPRALAAVPRTARGRSPGIALKHKHRYSTSAPSLGWIADMVAGNAGGAGTATTAGQEASRDAAEAARAALGDAGGDRTAATGLLPRAMEDLPDLEDVGPYASRYAHESGPQAMTEACPPGTEADSCLPDEADVEAVRRAEELDRNAPNPFHYKEAEAAGLPDVAEAGADPAKAGTGTYVLQDGEGAAAPAAGTASAGLDFPNSSSGEQAVAEVLGAAGSTDAPPPSANMSSAAASAQGSGVNPSAPSTASAANAFTDPLEDYPDVRGYDLEEHEMSALLARRGKRMVSSEAEALQAGGSTVEGGDDNVSDRLGEGMGARRGQQADAGWEQGSVATLRRGFGIDRRGIDADEPAAGRWGMAGGGLSDVYEPMDDAGEQMTDYVWRPSDAHEHRQEPPHRHDNVGGQARQAGVVGAATIGQQRGFHSASAAYMRIYSVSNWPHPTMDGYRGPGATNSLLSARRAASGAAERTPAGASSAKPPRESERDPASLAAEPGYYPETGVSEASVLRAMGNGQPLDQAQTHPEDGSVTGGWPSATQLDELSRRSAAQQPQQGEHPDPTSLAANPTYFPETDLTDLSSLDEAGGAGVTSKPRGGMAADPTSLASYYGGYYPETGLTDVSQLRAQGEGAALDRHETHPEEQRGNTVADAAATAAKTTAAAAGGVISGVAAAASKLAGSVSAAASKAHHNADHVEDPPLNRWNRREFNMEEASTRNRYLEDVMGGSATEFDGPAAPFDRRQDQQPHRPQQAQAEGADKSSAAADEADNSMGPRREDATQAGPPPQARAGGTSYTYSNPDTGGATQAGTPSSGRHYGPAA